MRWRYTYDPNRLRHDLHPNWRRFWLFLLLFVGTVLVAMGTMPYPFANGVAEHAHWVAFFASTGGQIPQYPRLPRGMRSLWAILACIAVFAGVWGWGQFLGLTRLPKEHVDVSVTAFLAVITWLGIAKLVARWLVPPMPRHLELHDMELG